MTVVNPKELITPQSEALGAWVKLPASESVEIFASAGFDFIVIDMEHSPLSAETVARHIALGRALGLVVMVRVGDHSASTIQLMLDSGAQGLFVPRVDSYEDAQSIVSAFSFPPHGIRGSGGTSRAGSWGLSTATQYRSYGNEEAFLSVQLESKSGIEAARQIAAIPQVAALFVGTADLALSLGEALDSPRVAELIAIAKNSAREAGKPFGLAGATVRAASLAFEQGANFVVGSNDATLLAKAAATFVAELRS